METYAKRFLLPTGILLALAVLLLKNPQFAPHSSSNIQEPECGVLPANFCEQEQPDRKRTDLREKNDKWVSASEAGATDSEIASVLPSLPEKTESPKKKEQESREPVEIDRSWLEQELAKEPLDEVIYSNPYLTGISNAVIFEGDVVVAATIHERRQYDNFLDSASFHSLMLLHASKSDVHVVDASKKVQPATSVALSKQSPKDLNIAYQKYDAQAEEFRITFSRYSGDAFTDMNFIPVYSGELAMHSLTLMHDNDRKAHLLGTHNGNYPYYATNKNANSWMNYNLSPEQPALFVQPRLTRGDENTLHAAFLTLETGRLHHLFQERFGWSHEVVADNVRILGKAAFSPKGVLSIPYADKNNVIAIRTHTNGGWKEESLGYIPGIPCGLDLAYADDGTPFLLVQAANRIVLLAKSGDIWRSRTIGRHSSSALLSQPPSVLFHKDRVILVYAENSQVHALRMMKNSIQSFPRHNFAIPPPVNDTSTVEMRDAGWRTPLGSPDRSLFHSHASERRVGYFHKRAMVNLFYQVFNANVLTGNVIGDESLEIVTISGKQVHIYNIDGELVSSFAVGGSFPFLGLLHDIDDDSHLEIGIGVQDARNHFFCAFFDAHGRMKKQFALGSGKRLFGQPVIIHEGQLVCETNSLSSSKGALALFDIETGEQIWHTQLDNFVIAPSLAEIEDRDYIVPYLSATFNLDANESKPAKLLSQVVNFHTGQKISYDYGTFPGHDFVGLITMVPLRTTGGRRLIAAKHGHLGAINGEGAFWELQPQQQTKTFLDNIPPSDTTFLLAFHDFDKDGNDELLVSSYRRLRNTKMVDFAAQTTRTMPYRGNIAFINDLLGTGKPQIYLRHHSILVAYDPKNLEELWRKDFDSSLASLVVSDLDQDGDNELVVQNRQGLQIYSATETE